MNVHDKILLRKRALIETIHDELKNTCLAAGQVCQIEHSRHRSFLNFLTNLLAGLIAYTFLPKKPAIKCYFEESNHLAFCWIELTLIYLFDIDVPYSSRAIY